MISLRRHSPAQQAPVAPEPAPSPRAVRRSVLFCGAGAVVGLVIAGVGLFTAQGTRTSHVPAEDVALVNQVPILRSDFIQQLRALYGVNLSQATREQKARALNDMIREELYVQRGVELGMANDDVDVRSALVTATEAQTSSDVTTAGASEAELRAYFASHAAVYASEGRIELNDWLVPAGRSAQGAAAALKGGAAPAGLGLVASGKVSDGEEFYFAARIHLGPQLFDIARRMKDGEVSAPVEQAGQTHILAVARNHPPVPARFEDVRDRVLADYLKARIAELQKRNDQFLRKRADIKLAPDLS